MVEYTCTEGEFDETEQFEFTEKLEGDTPLGGEMRVSMKSVTKRNNHYDHND